jgi:hypothetical protein
MHLLRQDEVFIRRFVDGLLYFLLLKKCIIQRANFSDTAPQNSSELCFTLSVANVGPVPGSVWRAKSTALDFTINILYPASFFLCTLRFFFFALSSA